MKRLFVILGLISLANYALATNAKCQLIYNDSMAICNEIKQSAECSMYGAECPKYEECTQAAKVIFDACEKNSTQGGA